MLWPLTDITSSQYDVSNVHALYGCLMKSLNNICCYKLLFLNFSVYWAMSLQVCVWEVVYVHVHRSQTSDALILVGQDGVQRPPIQFPKGVFSNISTYHEIANQLDPLMEISFGDVMLKVHHY